MTSDELVLAKQVREDIKQRVLDCLRPPLNCGHDWSTGEYVYPDPEWCKRQGEMMATFEQIIDNYCKFEWEL